MYCIDSVTAVCTEDVMAAAVCTECDGMCTGW